MGPPGPPFRMSLIEPPEPRPRTFSEVLESLGYGASPKLTLDELVEAFGDRGFGALILVLSLLALLPWPPGGKAVFAVPIALLSLELALQRDTVWLPRWALRASVPRDAYRALVSTPLAAPAWLRRWVLTRRFNLGFGVYVFSPWVRRAVRRRPQGLSMLRGLRRMEQLTKPRMAPLTGEIADTIIGLLCVLLSIVMALPIPLGDALPGVALVLFALGMMQRDGVAIILGALASAACGLYLFVIWRTVAEAVQHIAGWFAHLPG